MLAWAGQEVCPRSKGFWSSIYVAISTETPILEPVYVGTRTDEIEDHEMSGPPDKTEMFSNKTLPMAALPGNKMEEDPLSL